jgi:HSP90 family molecular chaperone
MNTAFEITVEDIQSALFSKKEIEISDEQANDFYQNIDTDEVERSALFGNDMEEQTEFAFQSIIEQLEELELI